MPSLSLRLVAFTLIIALAAAVLALPVVQAQDSRLESRVSRLTDAFLASYNQDFSQGRLDVWTSHWAEDALSESSSEHWRGREQIRAVYQEMFNAWDRLSLVRERSRIVQGSQVAWQGYFSARHRLAQRDVLVPVALFLTFNDSGAVQQARFYIDVQHLTDQLGESAAGR